ncbi:hypothetical protein [Cyclobacterium roseum]|uniref:hypothetical protein n=1 Tax=Cyclobacterium roseum TaxID=2666137 RepID=UPI001390B985|nr:hypothetical protein [Cyclobacterium roseum]
MISEQQFEIISRAVRHSEIADKALQDDLIDHFCCVVEAEMQSGQSFENAFQAAYAQITPNGFGEIQQETLYLLNYKKRLRLNQCTYLSGYVFALSATLGTFFKIMSLPGGTSLLYAGMLGFAFVFLPLLLVNKLKNRLFLHLSGKLQWLLGSLSGMVLIAACLFKLLHLQGAGVLLALGFLLFGLGFLPFFFFRMFKASQSAT